MCLKTGVLLTTASALIAALAMGQDNWSQFRGPDSTGVAQGVKLPLRWSATENVVWKTEIPGKGWSSPIVWHGRIIVTSAVGESEAVAPRTGLYIQNMRGRLGGGEFRFMVYCLDWQTGKILWEKTAYQGRPQVAIHAKNSYATATPVADGEQVVACFGTAGLFCYGLDGQAILVAQVGRVSDTVRLGASFLANHPPGPGVRGQRQRNRLLPAGPGQVDRQAALEGRTR